VSEGDFVVARAAVSEMLVASVSQFARIR
jgi:hypothetical protein